MEKKGDPKENGKEPGAPPRNVKRATYLGGVRVEKRGRKKNDKNRR